MNVNPRIDMERRSEIAYRINGGTSVVQASALQSANDLAYGIRFLADHFTYKRSKGLGGINGMAANEALQALKAAVATFEQEVLGVKSAAPVTKPVSPLADGIVGNPFENTK
jgi:hypothetical protein